MEVNTTPGRVVQNADSHPDTGVAAEAVRVLLVAEGAQPVRSYGIAECSMSMRHRQGESGQRIQPACNAVERVLYCARRTLLPVLLPDMKHSAAMETSLRRSFS